MSDERNYWIRRRISRRTALRGAGIGATGLLGAALIGCGDDDDDDDDSAPAAAATTAPTAAAAPAASRGQVDIAQSSLDTQPGDPHMSTSGIQEPIRRAANTGLYHLAVEGDTVPRVAESIEAADDYLSYTVKVREGITFTNGDPLTGEDVKFSFDRVAAVGTRSTSWLRKFERAELVDAMTVKVYQTKIEPTAWLDLRRLYTVPRQYTESLDDGPWAENVFGDQPIGVGPYRLTENKIAVLEKFEAHDGYFLGAPFVKTVIVHVVPELTTKIRAASDRRSRHRAWGARGPGRSGHVDRRRQDSELVRLRLE